MIGLGKKDEHGRQVRIEHRGKNMRASRTGGIAVRAEKKVGNANIAANSSTGLRMSTRIAKGTRMALQSGRFQLIGRWRAGPLGFNLSKTGVSASVKSKAGTLNFLKPKYSSFKFGGVQLRGKRAAQIQAVYMLIIATVLLFVFLARMVVFLFWVLALAVLFVCDFLVGLIKGMRDPQGQNI